MKVLFVMMIAICNLIQARFCAYHPPVEEISKLAYIKWLWNYSQNSRVNWLQAEKEFRLERCERQLELARMIFERLPRFDRKVRMNWYMQQLFVFIPPSRVTQNKLPPILEM